jgi:hypothetical protein
MKIKSIITVISVIALLASPVRANDTKTEALKAGGAAAAGAVAGGAVVATTGSIGVAVAGTAVSIGAAPIVAIGAVIGLAGYGIYRIFK